MSLKHEFESQGVWLFRWRSYLPFAFVPLVVIAIFNGHHDGTHFWADLVWPVVCLTISITGLLLRVHCIGHAPPGTSGRNTTKQIADVLNTTGLYSVVRHPLYLGNFLISLGIIAQPACYWLTTIFALAFYLYYERIMFAEEAFLANKFGVKFDEWAAVTPSFIPNMRTWRWPDRAMCWNKVAKQEAAAIGVITIGFFAAEVGTHLATGSIEQLEPGWILFAIFGVAIYTALRAYKKVDRWKSKAARSLCSP